MLFNSIRFVLFFPIVTAVYYILPKNLKNIWLLLAGYYFYLCASPAYLPILVCSTLVTYAAGRALPGRETTQRKWILFFGVSCNLCTLFFFKYFSFACSVIGVASPFRILLPVGISFYLFQAIGYLVDVYRGTIPAERRFLPLALFISFFPCLLSGPITRAGDMIPQFDSDHIFDYDRIRHGLLRMLSGYFMKLVIAARLEIVTTGIIDYYQDVTPWALALGIVLYAFQIYCDFASYSELAIGAAEVMGFTLPENFRQPFFALRTAELWRRWHISLMKWFTDYLYIPLGGSKKGRIRKYLNILIVFALSGLWHGASWTYVCWGVLCGVFMVIGEILAPLRTGLISLIPVHNRLTQKLHHLLQIFLTFGLFCTALIFFRAPSLSAAAGMLHRIFLEFRPSDILTLSPFSLGLGTFNFGILVFALIILLLTDLIKEYRGGDAAAWLLHKSTPCRWAFYYTAVILILFSTQIGAANFIYFQF